MNSGFTEITSVQKRILEYASQIGWIILSQHEAEKLRHFDTSATLPSERAKNSYLFLKDILLPKVIEFNPKYTE